MMRRFLIKITLLLAITGFQFALQAQNSRYQMSWDVSPSPLDINVGRFGQIQTYINGVGQLYDPTTAPNSRNMFNGLFMLDGNYLIATRSDVLAGYNNRWGNANTVSAVSGAGTIANPWVISVNLLDFGGVGYGIYAEYSYVNGNDYFDVSITPTVPLGNTDTIKIFHLMDTYLDGSDDGSAYTVGTAPYSLVGVEGNPNIEAFIVGNKQWDRYASEDYYTLLNAPYFYGQLSNNLDYSATTDNATGVQWTLGVVSGVQSPITYRIGFSEGPISVSCGPVVKINRHISVNAGN